MKLVLFICLILFPLLAITQQKNNVPERYPPVEKVAAEFSSLLKRPYVDFNPSFQKINTDTVLIEKGFIFTEKTEKLPVLIYKPVNSGLKSFPVVICLHGTGGKRKMKALKICFTNFQRLASWA